MTKTIGLESASSTLDKLGDARPTNRGPMSWLNAAFALFAMTLLSQAKSRRLLVLSVLYTLPIVFVALFRYYGVGWRGRTEGYVPSLAEFSVIFNIIPQVMVPLTALVYASGMIQDEIEEQTITYLLIRPLPRWSIYVAKLSATVFVTAGLTALFTSLTYLVIGWGQADYWNAGALTRMFQIIALFTLSLIVYDALFGFLSLIMRRAIIVGVGYIILLEGVAANIDFVIRKMTVMYYFRVLCERWMDISKVWHNPGPHLTYNIDFETAPTLGASLMTVSIASAVVISAACYLMSTREFRVKTPEGS